MSLKDCQKDTDEFTKPFVPQYWKPLEILARLIEETGELGREVNDRWGAKKKKSTEDKKEVEDEISDIIFTLCCLANSQNIDLDIAWKNMMNKLHKRDADRYEKKEDFTTEILQNKEIIEDIPKNECSSKREKII